MFLIGFLAWKVRWVGRWSGGCVWGVQNFEGGGGVEGGTTGKGGVGELRTCSIKVFKVGHMKNSLPLYDLSILHICQLHHRIIKASKSAPKRT